MNEKNAINALRGHLRIAGKWDWNLQKVSFCDGFLAALNLMTGKQYGFSGTDIFVIRSDGVRLEV